MWKQVSAEGVCNPRVKGKIFFVRIARKCHFIRREISHIRDKQVEPAVVVEVKEICTRRVRVLSQSRRFCHVTEMTFAVVFKKGISMPSRRYVQVWIAIVVRIGKRC